MWLQVLAFFALIVVGLLPAMAGSIHGAPVREVILAAGIPIGRLGLDDAETARVLAAAASHAAGTAGAERLYVIPVGQAFVSREAPKRLANTMMGVWLLFGGVGVRVSGQIGGLAEPLGIRAVYLGIAVGCTLAACVALAFRKRIMGLLAA